MTWTESRQAVLHFWTGEASDGTDNFLLTCPLPPGHWGPMKWFYVLWVLEGARRKTTIPFKSTV